MRGFGEIGAPHVCGLRMSLLGFRVWSLSQRGEFKTKNSPVLPISRILTYVFSFDTRGVGGWGFGVGAWGLGLGAWGLGPWGLGALGPWGLGALAPWRLGGLGALGLGVGAGEVSGEGVSLETQT